MMHSPFIWCTDNSSLTHVGFGSLTYQSLTGVAFASLPLIWCRSCIWFVVVTMMHWRVYANWRRCCSKTKENILRSILAPLKNLQCSHCWKVVHSIRICRYKYLMKSWKRRKVISNTARQKHCASLIVVDPWTGCMLTLILSTVLILQYWSSIPVIGIYPIDVISVI